MTAAEEMVKRVERAMERYELSQMRQKATSGPKQRLCVVSGCYSRALGTKRFCVRHSEGINPLTIRERVMLQGDTARRLNESMRMGGRL